MRAFLVKASSAVTAPHFRPEGLASYGRMDVVARSAIAALRVREGVRRNVVFYAVLEGPPKPPILLEFRGAELDSIPLSEVEVGWLIKKALEGVSIRGVYVRRMGFRDVVLELLEILGRENVVYLHEDGLDLAHVRLSRDVAMILGDHRGLDYESERWLESLGLRWVSLGPIPYFTDQCIIFANYVLDRVEIGQRVL
ncbi:MAG: tRNA (pseudouridine(54)-N(1))-methyltransferase TrmY [Thermoprotei archaeon]|nr:MAG: tRNA (pseudouridine(54)-N(1))-methyltransferase TrmY [Thermoprotei archaeon]